jgi:hypothetical protein
MTTLLLRTAPLAGQTIYATSFENPPFANHSTLVGQNGWTAPPPLSPDAAQVATGIRATGKQAMRVDGRDLEHQDFINEVTGGYYDAIGSYRHPVNYDTQGNQIVRVSADVYLRGGTQTPAGNNFFSAAIGGAWLLTDGNAGGAGELAISSDGQVYNYCGCDFAPSFFYASAPITLDAWHNLAVEYDRGARTFTPFVDGNQLGGPFDFPPADPNDPTVDFTDTLLRGSLLTYAAPDTDSLKKQNFAAYFDNFSITASPVASAVPEPASAVLLLAGVVLLSLDGRRRCGALD